MVMGLTTGIWVAAQVRICDRNFIPATIVRRGDSCALRVMSAQDARGPEEHDHCDGSIDTGSMVWLPPRRISKCRRGLAAPPELPARAMVWPFFTSSPFLANSDSLLP